MSVDARVSRSGSATAARAHSHRGREKILNIKKQFYSKQLIYKTYIIHVRANKTDKDKREKVAKMTVKHEESAKKVTSLTPACQCSVNWLKKFNRSKANTFL